MGERQPRRNFRPTGAEQRNRAIKMGQIVEREAQRQRNLLMQGLPVRETISALWRNGQVIVQRVVVNDSPRGESA